MKFKTTVDASLIFKLPRLQIISYIVQLEDKNYIECSVKGCRCITFSVLEMANHLQSCSGAKSNDKLKYCKYCPHGTLSDEKLSNHIICSHPYAVYGTPGYSALDMTKEYVDVSKEDKAAYSSSPDFKEAMKYLWRIHLQSKGYIMCPVPVCNYVTCYIPQMESHFLECSRGTWDYLTFCCEQCRGQTATLEALTAHTNECHPPENNFVYPCFNSPDDNILKFWELSFESFGASKCVTKHCKFVCSDKEALKKHYRYCRVPHVENHEVCSYCGGWLETIRDLILHKEQFHVVGKAKKIHALMTVDVHSPDFSWPKNKADGSALWSTAMKKLQAQPPSENPRSLHRKFPRSGAKRAACRVRTTSDCVGTFDIISVEDILKKKSSFLEELGRTISTQSTEEPSVHVNVTANDQTWTLEVPNLNTAAEVVNRRLPSYSVKKILAESMEDGAQLLKHSAMVTKIECCIDRPYVPPRPLNFVVENVDTLAELKKKFLPCPAPQQTSSKDPSNKTSTDNNEFANMCPAKTSKSRPKNKSLAQNQKSISPIPACKNSAKTIPAKNKLLNQKNINLQLNGRPSEGSVQIQTPSGPLILVRCSPPDYNSPPDGVRKILFKIPDEIIAKQFKMKIPIKTSDLQNLANLSSIINGVVKDPLVLNNKEIKTLQKPPQPVQVVDAKKQPCPQNSGRAIPVAKRSFEDIVPSNFVGGKTYPARRINLQPPHSSDVRVDVDAEMPAYRDKCENPYLVQQKEFRANHYNAPTASEQRVFQRDVQNETPSANRQHGSRNFVLNETSFANREQVSRSVVPNETYSANRQHIFQGAVQNETPSANRQHGSRNVVLNETSFSNREQVSRSVVRNETYSANRQYIFQGAVQNQTPSANKQHVSPVENDILTATFEQCPSSVVVNETSPASEKGISTSVVKNETSSADCTCEEDSKVWLSHSPRRDSPIPLELPILPSAKSINLEEINPISDYYPGMCSSQNNFLPESPRALRTYGRKTNAMRLPISYNIANETCPAMRNFSEQIVPNQESRCANSYRNIFDDDLGRSECDDEEAKPLPDVLVKVEPLDDPEDTKVFDVSPDQWCEFQDNGLFYENYDIFSDQNEVDPLSFDVSVNIDNIIYESIAGGLYNNSCPWEPRTKRRKDKTYKINNTALTKNPYRSSKFPKNHTCGLHSNTNISDENILNEADPCCLCSSNKKTVKEEIDYSKNDIDRMKELTNFLSNVNDIHFVNEPLVYAVDRIIYDRSPNVDGSAAKKNSSKASANSKNVKLGEITSANASSSADCSQSGDKSAAGVAESIKSKILPVSDSSVAKSTSSEQTVSGSSKRKCNRSTVKSVQSNCSESQEPEVKSLLPSETVRNDEDTKSQNDVTKTSAKSDNLSVDEGSSSKKKRTAKKPNADTAIPLMSKSSSGSDSAKTSCEKSQGNQLDSKCLVGEIRPGADLGENCALGKNTEKGRRKRGRPSKYVAPIANDSLASELFNKEDTSSSENIKADGKEISSTESHAGGRTDAKSSENDDQCEPPKKRRRLKNVKNSDESVTLEMSVHEEAPASDNPTSDSSGTPAENLRGNQLKFRQVPMVKEIRPGLIVACEEESNLPGTSAEVGVPRRRGRSSKKLKSSNDSDIPEPKVDIPEPKVEESKPQEGPAPKRRGRPPKRKLTQPTMHDDNDRSFLYLPGDDAPSTGDPGQRIDFSKVLTDPHKIVVCAVCGENMTALVYKKEHLRKHNYMCWVVGEEPMDLDDEKSLEKYLYKIYLRTRASFTCEVCHCVKKSAQGFLSHRKFCGKTLKQRQEMMVSCTICSRILKPSSLPHHMVHAHAAEKPAEPSTLDARAAATKCLNIISAAVKDLKNEQEYVDDSEETKAVEKDSWIRQAYSFIRRRVAKEVRSIIETAAAQGTPLKCLIAGCTYTDSNPTVMMEHYKVCDKEPLDCRCNECNFITNSEPRIINHIRMCHYHKAKDYANKLYKANEVADVSECAGTFIPYIKSGEMTCRSLIYLQPSLYWTHQLRAEHFSVDYLYPEWEVDNEADMKPLDEFSSYMDLREESMRIAFSQDRPEWLRLRKLTNHRFGDGAMIMYTGGIVRSFEWFPSPNQQFLAVSVGCYGSESIPIHPLHSGRGHVQIWSAGTLENFGEPYPLDLKFEYAICHEFGEVWDMQCCPSGAYGDKRLGLLALGTSSGKIPVYSVPLPESSEERALMPDPVVVLDLRMDESYQVSKISWSQTKPHRFIAAGFTSGMVAVWDLTTTSTLLREGKIRLPFKLFYPHLTIITGLSFSPVNEYYIATACSEKSTKFWNLHDTSDPHTEFTRGLVTDISWMQHWMGTLVTMDDNYTTGSTTVALNPIRNFIYQSQPAVTQADSCGTSVSVNNWLNIFVSGYDSGQVVLSVGRKHTHHVNDDRRKLFNALISPQLYEFNPDAKEMIDCKSYASTCKNFGIIFNHNFHVANQTKIKANPCSDLTYFPLNPVNKVSWNPNPSSFLTLGTAFNAGFIIVSKIHLPKNEIGALKTIVEGLNKPSQ